ncbi:peroxiredoxin family protein [Telmatocola sphagniphila]|uniref:Peroxiredoxin family protein n=1 Tax=Telmatocola sphagniphila TaxID=1123043 RepID=A0A8E6B3S5_9BACT|nr:redoxin domain-containing protein [Telmatocola sphagniphila]QVL30591.1 peroxiredoxin family protein [Telmatocola sphagniphila]
MRTAKIILLVVVAALVGGSLVVMFDPDLVIYSEGPEPKHKDDVETNVSVTAPQFDLSFLDCHGNRVDLSSYRDQKNVMLVFMRGYPGDICVNCSAQTSRLIKNYRDFSRRDTEILVVFPGPTEYLEKYIAISRKKAGDLEVPFKILLDPNYVAVDRLGIRGSLAKPSTYILDKKGQVRFAYVGAYTGDRPSIKAMLDQIDRIRDSGDSE